MSAADSTDGGWLDRSRAIEVMRAGHVLLITSLRDLTSTVTVEGMGLGLPVVCPDHCGFADAVDDTCGIRVPVRLPDEFVEGVAEAIERLGTDESARRGFAEGALRKARWYDWDAKAQQVDELYRAAVAAGKAVLDRAMREER
jgi:glycosyltransferase involved in cell wall biosynthesis